MDAIANPSIAQQRRDRLQRAKEKKTERMRLSRRFLSERNNMTKVGEPE